MASLSFTDFVNTDAFQSIPDPERKKKILARVYPDQVVKPQPVTAPPPLPWEMFSQTESYQGLRPEEQREIELKHFGKYGELEVRREAAKQGVDPDLMVGLLFQESGGDPAAVSPMGAQGLMQLMPAAAEDMGVDRMIPSQNVQGGIGYFKQQLDDFSGDEDLALAAYYAGPSKVRQALSEAGENWGDWLNSNTTTPYGQPDPTDYINQVRGRTGKESPSALTGELGDLPRPDGGISTELSVTVTDERLNHGQPTNIPLLVQGQQGVDALLGGADPTEWQMEFAINRAAERAAMGQALPSYDSIEDAAARERSEEKPITPVPQPEDQDPASYLAAVLPQQQGVDYDQYQQEGMGEAGAIRTLGNLYSGFNTFAAGMVDIAPYLIESTGIPISTKAMNEWADFHREQAASTMPDDPQFVDKAVAGLATSIGFLIPGMAVARGARALAGVSELLATTFGVSAASVQEGLFEAGDTYDYLVKGGMSPEEAQKKAHGVAVKNIATLAVTNLAGGMFNPAQRGIIRRAVQEMPFSAIEEGLQEVYQLQAEDQPIRENLDQIKEATAIGAIIGPVIGGAVGAYDQRGRRIEPTPGQRPDAEQERTAFRESLLGDRPVFGDETLDQSVDETLTEGERESLAATPIQDAPTEAAIMLRAAEARKEGRGRIANPQSDVNMRTWVERHEGMKALAGLLEDEQQLAETARTQVGKGATEEDVRQRTFDLRNEISEMVESYEYGPNPDTEGGPGAMPDQPDIPRGMSLAQWVAKKGGIRPLAEMGEQDTQHRLGLHRFPGLLNSKSGGSIEDIMRAAIQEGGFQIAEDDISGFIEMLGEDVQAALDKNPMGRIWDDPEWAVRQAERENDQLLDDEETATNLAVLEPYDTLEDAYDTLVSGEAQDAQALFEAINWGGRHAHELANVGKRQLRSEYVDPSTLPEQPEPVAAEQPAPETVEAAPEPTAEPTPVPEPEAEPTEVAAAEPEAEPTPVPEPQSIVEPEPTAQEDQLDETAPVLDEVAPVLDEMEGEQATTQEVQPTPVPERPEVKAIQEAADDAATSPANERPEPTQPQKEAGNYKKGHVRLKGMDISIENPKGSTRSGVGRDGEEWSVEMPAHYGYIRRTEGADGDQVDVYIGDNIDSDTVFVVDQLDADTKEFDEHKAFIGYDTMEEVVEVYNQAFDDGRGPERLGDLTALTLDEFKQWARTEDTTKPVAEARPRIPARAPAAQAPMPRSVPQAEPQPRIPTTPPRDQAPVPPPAPQEETVTPEETQPPEPEPTGPTVDEDDPGIEVLGQTEDGRYVIQDDEGREVVVRLQRNGQVEDMEFSDPAQIKTGARGLFQFPVDPDRVSRAIKNYQIVQAELEATLEETQPPEPETPAAPPQPTGRQISPANARKLLDLPSDKTTLPSGPALAELRQDILEDLTGKRPPKSKAGVSKVVNALYEAFGINPRAQLTRRHTERALLDALGKAAEGDGGNNPDASARADP